MRRSFFAASFLGICASLVAQQALNNDAVLRLVKAGLSDDVIVTTINASPGAYDISANALIALKSAGVSDKVIAAIVIKSSAPPPSTAGQEPTQNAGPAAATVASSTPATTQTEDEGTSHGSGVISRGSRIVIAPMGGFETYFAAAVRKKNVPVTLTLDKESAQYFVVSTNTDWQGFVYGAGASWNRQGGAAASAASSTRGLEASIMLIDAKTKDVVWAYEVHKASHGSLLFGTFGARGQQSIAEACAKHLKEFIENGR